MPQAFKEIVSGLVERIGITEQSFAVASLIENEIHKSAPTARIAGYKNNKIYVEVESSVQLYEFNLRRREILKILEAIPGAPVPELKFFLKGNARLSAAERIKPLQKSAVQKELKDA